MAPNKFATMLNRNTNKISIILIYAVLEWILIALILLNSLFSYLVIKFSEYFGLKPPCLWCTRLDNIFDPAKRGKNLHRDLLCEAHSQEISKLGYCLNHQKLVESQELCEDCLSSRPELNGSSKKFDFFSRVRDFGMIQRNEERMYKAWCTRLDINEEPKFQGPDSVEIGETEVSENFEESTYFYVKKIPSELASEFDQELEGAKGEKHSHVATASEEFSEMVTNENEADVSIGTEIPDLDITDEMQNQASILSYEAEHGSMQVDEQMVELKPLLVQETDHMTDDQHLFYSELYEIEEDKVPDTPNPVDSLNHAHKKLLLLEKKESGTEESVDRSVTNDLENGDGVVTMERLKSALRAERKNLQALYSELEEERSASAVAANQTMAMINRLQEDKAAMQMEALQYQRMMDEQTEYDQEALELLNELMVRREKEKIELEKELEMCKKKVLDYEAKEKMRLPRSSRDGSARSGFSSGSSNNCEDSDGPDGLSIDLNQEAREEGLFSTQEITTPVDAVANLEECLADFEEERFSILEQLKMLEEKLVAIDETEDLKQDNWNTDLHSNRCLLNGKNQPHRRMFVQRGKSLLPLFDAAIDASGHEVQKGDTNRIDSNGMHDTYESKFGTDNNKVAIEEEVDHLYQRLQAFEADKEFLKHCISSLKKGDKGMDLLQEILQHIRDLRNVEFRARNLMEKDAMTKSKRFFQKLVKPFTALARKDQNEADLEEIAAQAHKQFSFETLSKATNNFHPDQKLGEGGFGPVFKGKLADGRVIAVKKLSQRSSQGKKEFENEANLLALVQHRNVVNLLGFSVKGAEKLLVYEYVANESLDKLLFKSRGREVLDWDRRRDMITGIAKGLLYLHEDAHCCIIHRDIKASNILLNEKWEPKIADFGLARLYPEDQTHINTRVAGTNGYMAPEYLMRGNLSVKADVFSFGVVVLELISGQKNSTFNRDPDCQSLLEWAYKLYKKNRIIEFVDPTLAPLSDRDQISMFIQIGLLCTQSDSQIRPDMRRVVILLSRKPTVLDDPLRPGYTDSRYRKPHKAVTSSSKTGSSGESNSKSFGSTTGSQTVTATASTSRFMSEKLDSKKGKQPMQN